VGLTVLQKGRKYVELNMYAWQQSKNSELMRQSTDLKGLLLTDILQERWIATKSFFGLLAIRPSLLPKEQA
jgi:hypothetical protein